MVIPAHDEEGQIGRLLRALTTGPDGSTLEVAVVCNGCTDATETVARSFPGVAVLSTPVPSKRHALRSGDDLVTTFPRVYVDADVEIDASSVRRLVDEIEGGKLAAAPRRVVPRAGVSPVVRWYYDVWEDLPSVRSGLFGRGVIAVSAEGHRRIAALPSVMADDLAFSEAFSEDERVVCDAATVVVHPPRTLADLLRRRIRARTGTRQADAVGTRGHQTPTAPKDLMRLCLRPATAIRMPVFLAVTVLARTRASRTARRGDFQTWLRDDSSRTPVSAPHPDTPARPPADQPLVVWQAGVSWDAVTGTDRHLVSELAARGTHVLWVDPPTSVVNLLSRRSLSWRAFRPRPTTLGPHLQRLAPLAPPFPHRPGVDVLTTFALGVLLRSTVGPRPSARTVVVGTSPHPRLSVIPGAYRVYFATDDFPAGAALMGKGVRRFTRLERDRLTEADAVAAVSPEITSRWSRVDATVVANGVDVAHYTDVDDAPPPDDVTLPSPVAGLIGQLSPRVDLALLEAVANEGVSLLLVGPRQADFEPHRVDALIARPNVQWVGPKPFSELPSYLRVIDVGLTPYVENAFNRASFPLKTLEYLAGGRSAISTRLPSAARLDTRSIHTASSPSEFAIAVRRALAEPRTIEIVRERQRFAAQYSWSRRAAEFCCLAGLLRTESTRSSGSTRS